MSATMTRADGVTVFTLTFDSQSSWPPLCQAFKAMCYSPVCCSVSERLRTVQNRSQSVLGALHIMVGALNIGLGTILCLSGGGSWWQMDETLFPIWLGVLFMGFGVMCILSEKFPSPCLVVSSVILNLAGVVFAVTAIVLYSINLANISFFWMCAYDEYGFGHSQEASPSPELMAIREKCADAQTLLLMFTQSMNAVLIVLSVLELCVALSAAILGIRALRSGGKGSNQSSESDNYKPLLEEVTSG